MAASSLRRTHNGFRKFASRPFHCFGKPPAEWALAGTGCRKARLLPALPTDLSVIRSFSACRRSPDRPRRLPSLPRTGFVGAKLVWYNLQQRSMLLYWPFFVVVSTFVVFIRCSAHRLYAATCVHSVDLLNEKCSNQSTTTIGLLQLSGSIRQTNEAYDSVPACNQEVQ